MNWWGEVFLNEGLSTYAQYLGMEAASPDLMGHEYAILDAVQFSMLYDAGVNTHPLSHNVTTPEEIEEMFSTISYEKGASIVRMMEGFLTRETLRKGLQAYLKSRAFNGADKEDLFKSLQEAAINDNRLPADLTLSEIMHTWTDQSGFPLVTIQVSNDTHVIFQQQRFKNHDADDLEGLWYVPITVITQEQSQLHNNIPTLWLKKEDIQKEFPHNTSQWLMINSNATGFILLLKTAPNLEKVSVVFAESRD